MSRPHSANKHVPVEQYGRAIISPFGGYVQMPVPKPPAPDPARTARVTLNPAKAAAGHAMMNSRAYGTGASYEFRDRVGGIMPGYAGHRPGAQDVHHKMAYGGVPTFINPRARTPPGQGAQLSNRPTTSFQEMGCGWKRPEDKSASSEPFREAVGGVLAGYTGFVPNAKTHYGSSHVGSLSTSGARGHAAQAGHGARPAKELDLSARTQRSAAPVVGYQGHLPRAIDSYGTSYWRSKSQQTPRQTPRNAEALYSA